MGPLLSPLRGVLGMRAQAVRPVQPVPVPDDPARTFLPLALLSAKDGRTKDEMMVILHGSEPMPYLQRFLKALFVSIEHWQEVPQAEQRYF